MTTGFYPDVTPSAIGWPEDATLPEVDHTGATWCDHSVCEPMKDVDGSVSSIKTLFVHESDDGDRVEVFRRDEWTLTGGWKAGDPKIVGLTSALLLEDGGRIVSAALRVGFEMGAAQR